MNTITFEAFAPGTWNGYQFKRNDLEEIADNFAALEPYHKVPLKFGHTDKQPMTDGQPALGWVTKAEVNEEGKLMLTAEDVPALVKKAIEKKLYRKVSIELDVDVEHKGKKYRYVLSGVALLGADIPAVNTLADLKHYLDDKPALAATRRTVFSAIQGSVTEDEEDEMTPAEIQAEIQKGLAPVLEKVTTLSAENDKLKTENAQFKREKEEGDRKAAGEKVKLARAACEDVLEAAVKQEIILPAAREAYRKSFGVNDDERVVKIDIEDFKQIVCQGKKLEMSKPGTTQGGGDGRDKTRVHEDAGEEIVRLTKEEMGKSANLTYQSAQQIVMSRNPDLSREWLGTVN